MLQYIVLSSYVGLSSDYIFDQDCDGKPISDKEAIELGLTSQGEIQRHRKSDYQHGWYKIVPGNEITITIYHGKDYIDRVFTIPDAGLPEPPVSLDDERLCAMHEYLSQHCLSRDIDYDDGDEEEED